MSPPLHSFVVPAYRFSPHLRECLESLKRQTVSSEIVVSTSTPCKHVENTCAELGVKLVVHGPNRGIADDWNKALSAATGPLVTLAHQDDVYYENFSEETLRAIGDRSEAVLAFTDYDEITDLGVRPKSRLLAIKKFLLEVAFAGRSRIGSRFAKRNALRFACPIACPAVTINKRRFVRGFDERFEVNLDWATWIAAADCEGDFVWVRRRLMGHRIHEGSETTAAISDGRRQKEDEEILGWMWPKPLAALIRRSYRIAYASNHAD